MKKLHLLILLVLAIGMQSCMLAIIALSTEQLALNPKVLNQLKGEKVIIATPEAPKKATAEERESVDTFNDFAVEMIKKHWKYCEIHDVMPFEEAEKFAKKNKGYHLLWIGNTGYRITASGGASSGAGDYSSLGTALYFYNGITIKPAAFEMPFTGEKRFFNEISAYASLMALQDMLRQIETKKINSQQKYANNKNRNTAELRKKTLLIPDYMVDDKLGEKGIKEYYKFNIEICDREKYNNSILHPNEDYVLLLQSTVPVGKSWYRQIMFYDSKTWECYAAYRLPSRGIISNYVVFDTNDYDQFLKLNKKTWKQIAKVMKSV